VTLLRLFFEFCKIGLFSVGGGLATIPFLADLGERTGWFTSGELANMIAISESTPGPLGVNMATYVGFVTGMQDKGILTALLGAVTATFGLVLPSMIVILIVAAILSSFRNSPYVNRAFYGLRPASTGLIAAAGLTVIASNLFFPELWQNGNWLGAFNWKGIVLAVVLWCLTNVVKKTKKLHPIVFIGFSALVGILFQMG
jgi:chromate transporter